MQGILIDPKAKTITTCEVDNENPLQSLCALMRCPIVERVALGGGNILLVDEEGKLEYPNKDGYFTFSLCPKAVFAGCAVILPSFRSSWQDTGFSIEEVQGLVEWCSPTEKQAKLRAFVFLW